MGLAGVANEGCLQAALGLNKGTDATVGVVSLMALENAEWVL